MSSLSWTAVWKRALATSGAEASGSASWRQDVYGSMGRGVEARRLESEPLSSSRITHLAVHHRPHRHIARDHLERVAQHVRALARGRLAGPRRCPELGDLPSQCVGVDGRQRPRARVVRERWLALRPARGGKSAERVAEGGVEGCAHRERMKREKRWRRSGCKLV
jgi:hypothetical protein